MARFRFKLQPVLELREREERDRQVVVAQLEAQKRDLEDALRARQLEMTQQKEDLRARLEPGSADGDPAQLRAQAASTFAIQAKANHLLLRLAGVHHQLEGARAVLAEASKRRRAVELLKERRLERWRADIKHREAAVLDDIATTRFGGGGAIGAALPGPDGEDRTC